MIVFCSKSSFHWFWFISEISFAYQPYMHRIKLTIFSCNCYFAFSVHHIPMPLMLGKYLCFQIWHMRICNYDYRYFMILIVSRIHSPLSYFYLTSAESKHLLIWLLLIWLISLFLLNPKTLLASTDLANTRSFMIFLFQVYWIDAFGIWSDINHYIYVKCFFVSTDKGLCIRDTIFRLSVEHIYHNVH
jgi:hypothetical protein